MTEFWSGWVILLTVFTLGASLFLFIYGLRVDIPTQPDGTSGHVWAHGVLREECAESSDLVDRDLGDRVRRRLRLPCALSWLRCVQGRSRLDRARRARTRPGRKPPTRGAAARARPRQDGRSPSPPTRRHCARAECCSSRTARHATAETGEATLALGAPDLTDGDWLYGGDGKAILTSILDGRRGAMPAFAGTLSRRIDPRPRPLRREPVRDTERLLARAAWQAALLQLRAVPRRRRQRQPGAWRAEPHRCRLALRQRQPAEHRRRPFVGGRNGVMPAWRDRLGMRMRCSSRPGSTHNRTRRPSPPDDVSDSRDTRAWFRAPVAWLGAAILVASIAAMHRDDRACGAPCRRADRNRQRQRTQGPAATLGCHAATRATDTDERLLALRRAAARQCAAGAALRA